MILFFVLCQRTKINNKAKNYPNKIKKVTIKAKSAIASVKAKPKIATLNKSCLNEGFREIPRIKEPKTVPIPAPAPANPIVAKPPPIFLAASKSMIYISDRCGHNQETMFPLELLTPPSFSSEEKRRRKPKHYLRRDLQKVIL